MLIKLLSLMGTLLISGPLLAGEPTFMAKPLSELLQYTGARCAFLVRTIKINPEMDYVYTTTVEAKQEMRWGEESQFDRKLRNFQVVSINNLKVGHVPQDEGDDYYFGAVSPNALKVGEKYIFLCRGAKIFEAIPATDQNIAKIKLFMNMSWQKIYARKSNLPELLRDLKDPDLYRYAYENLRKRGKLNLNIIIAALRGGQDVGLLGFHLRSLADPNDPALLIDDSSIEIKSSKQLNFLQYLTNEVGLQKDEYLLSAVSRIINDPNFFQELSLEKARVINVYLAILNKHYREKLPERNHLLVTLVSFLQGNQKYAHLFQEPYFLYAASVVDSGKVLTTYVEALRPKDRINFLNKLITLYDALAVVKHDTKAHIGIFKLLEVYLPENPSPLYLKKLSSFNPIHLSDKATNFAQFAKYVQGTDVWKVQESASGVISGANMVLNSINAILQKFPDHREEVRLIGEQYVGAKSLYKPFINQELAGEFDALIKTTEPLGVAPPPAKTTSENGATSVH